MRVVFSEDFYQVYTSDPASAPGRMEAVVSAITPVAQFVDATPATPEQLAEVHTPAHIQSVKKEGVYDIASRAAGGAVEAARIALSEPAFALVRPPGHHASADSCWGFCYFNNMAVAMHVLKHEGRISNAFVLDIDLHFGDGTAHIANGREWLTVENPSADSRKAYIEETADRLAVIEVDMIGVSAGFDNHIEDWGGLLATDDYRTLGSLVRDAARRCSGGCFGILEGGYNHDVLGNNVRALIEGMTG